MLYVLECFDHVMTLLFCLLSIRKVQSQNCECSVATVRQDVTCTAGGGRGLARAHTLHFKSTHSYKTCWIFLPFAFWS